MKRGRDEALMDPYVVEGILARSAQGRIQGGTKIGFRGGGALLKIFFFRPEGYNNNPNA